MEQFKRLSRKLFFPKPWMTLLSIPVAAVLLIYTFAGGHKEDWIAIPAYVFSAYSLSLVCARVGLLAGHAKEDAQLIIDKVPLAHRYFSDVSFKLHISLYLSLGLNVIYAVMKSHSASGIIPYGAGRLQSIISYWPLCAFFCCIMRTEKALAQTESVSCKAIAYAV